MTIEEAFRHPSEIIFDLLTKTSPEERAAVEIEAKAYIARIRSDKNAWKRMAELHEQNYIVRYDPGL